MELSIFVDIVEISNFHVTEKNLSMNFHDKDSSKLHVYYICRSSESNTGNMTLTNILKLWKAPFNQEYVKKSKRKYSISDVLN